MNKKLISLALALVMVFALAACGPKAPATESNAPQSTPEVQDPAFSKDLTAFYNDLMNAAQELAAMWQGDANNTFNNALSNDQDRWISFAALVDTYVETLRHIVQTWHEVEGENIGIASRRTY